MHLERWLEASEAFRAVQRDPAATQVLRDDAAHYIADIEPRLGRLRLDATGPRDGVTVTIDGHDATPLLGVIAPCDPGDHLIEAHRDGVVVATTTVHVDSAAHDAVSIAIPDREVTPVAATPSVAPVVSADPQPSMLDAEDIAPAHHTEVYEEWWFWTIIGVGIAAGVGVTAGVLSTQSSVPPMGSLGTIDARP